MPDNNEVEGAKAVPPLASRYHRMSFPVKVVKFATVDPEPNDCVAFAVGEQGVASTMPITLKRAALSQPFTVWLA